MEHLIPQEWFVADANGQNLGRFATKIASIIIGKHKPGFTPGVDVGDYVVVVNCERLVVTGKKLDDKKFLGMIMNNLGAAYEGLNNSELALENYQHALEINLKVGDQMKFISLYFKFLAISNSLLQSPGSQHENLEN